MGVCRPYATLWGPILCLVLLCAGCGVADPVAAEPDVDLAAAPVITTLDQVRRPIDEFAPTVEQVLAVAATTERLVQECMVDAGEAQARYIMGDSLARFVKDGVDSGVVYSRLWGFFSPSTVDQYGFHRPPDAEGGFEATVTGAVDQTIGPRCERTVREATPGGGWSSLRGTSGMPDGGPPEPIGDSRVVVTVQQWSRCMKARGYEATDPTQFMAPFMGGPSASADEIAAAQADLACKADVNLIGIAVAVQSAYDELYIENHRAELEAWRDEIDAFIRQGA